MNEVYEKQQERKRNEKWYGKWEDIRSAILLARGAVEGEVLDDSDSPYGRSVEWRTYAKHVTV